MNHGKHGEKMMESLDRLHARPCDVYARPLWRYVTALTPSLTLALSQGESEQRDCHHYPPKPAEMVKQMERQPIRMFRNPFEANGLRDVQDSPSSFCFTTDAKSAVMRFWRGKCMGGNGL